jgi:hypothetical protein
VTSGWTGEDTGGKRPSATAAAYSFEAHLNGTPGGWGVAAMLFGALGPPDHSFSVFALALNLGWFGE